MSPRKEFIEEKPILTCSRNTWNFQNRKYQLIMNIFQFSCQLSVFHGFSILQNTVF